MKTKKKTSEKPDEIVDEKFPGYPKYPARDDIYNKYDRIDEADPEISARKKHSVLPVPDNEYGNTALDVPGAEMDDEQEAIGNEDEENNYYSIGGDNHNDLEENQGDELF